MRVTGVFACAADAERARQALIAIGIDGDCVTLSVSQAVDGIAAEAPGQSYENQPGQAAADSKASWYATAVRSGDCALTVDAATAAERARVGEMLRSCGARSIARPPR